ncbi:MAG: hypothetical protein R2757_20130 [Draconibacterium sp.]
MLVKRKRAYAKTTNSYHFHKYNNLIKRVQVTKPNQVWVSDITYIRTVKGFLLPGPYNGHVFTEDNRI